MSSETGTNMLPGELAALMLFESLLHVLIEQRVLTRGDALGVIETVTELLQEQRLLGDRSNVSATALIENIRMSLSAIEETRPARPHGKIDLVKRILLVEDDLDVQFVLEKMLLAAGYAVDSVSNTAAARLRLGMRAYDLVLADGKLGDGTGFEIADLGAGHGAKTLIVTGYASSFANELDRYPHLIKPVRAPEVVTTVSQLIGPGDFTTRSDFSGVP